jgi:tight adherence protein C
MQVHEFYFEKVLTALALEAVLLVGNVAFERLGLMHVGIWPLWLWLGVGALGFVWPDLEIRRRAHQYQTRIRAELPTLVDLLAVAVSTGRGIEDALVDVAPFLTGPLAREWGRLEQQLVRGLPAALEDIAARTGVPEMETLIGYLVAAYERGQALEVNLIQLAETLRERRLNDVMAAGGRATERMFLPLVVFVVVPLLVLVIAPAGASLFGLLAS